MKTSPKTARRIMLAAGLLISLLMVIGVLIVGVIWPAMTSSPLSLSSKSKEVGVQPVEALDETHKMKATVTPRIVVTPTPVPTVTAPPTATAALATSDEVAKGIIADTADKVIRALRDKDMETLAQLVDPTNGVEFSPYIASDGNRFRADQVAGLFQDKTKYPWGYSEGSGEPIELTFATYYQKFIYDLDYAHPTRITFNAAGLGYFEDASLPAPAEDRILVEYVVAQEGMYDQGLILIFERDQAKAWYLVRVIHDGWLI